jgi:hypothetical protein
VQSTSPGTDVRSSSGLVLGIQTFVGAGILLVCERRHIGVIAVLMILSRLVYIGSKAYVSERRRSNTVNPEGLVRRRYVVGKEDQTSSDIKMQVSNR